MKTRRAIPPRILIVIGALALSACGSADMAVGAPTAGATPGGAQDAGLFRGQLEAGMVPDASSITLEGFLSEHDISDIQCGHTLCLMAQVGNDRDLVAGGGATFVQLAMGSNVDLTQRSRMPLNLAVVVDVSGSMSGDGKLEFVKDGLLLMLQELDAEDRLSLVTYSSSAQVVIASQPVSDRARFESAVQNLTPNGTTNLHAGMMLGYEQVQPHTDPTVLSRVMLLSDGIANEGVTDSASIIADSATFASEGIGLTTIGVGIGFNHDLMKDLSEQGGGNFYFIEDPQKVVTVFQDELDFLVTPLAHNLSVTIDLGAAFALKDAFGIDTQFNSAGQLVLDVPTVFASRRGGGILIQVEGNQALSELSGDVVTALEYTYDPVADDGTELAPVSFNQTATLPPLDFEDDRVFDSHGVLKSIVLWNMVNTFQEASNRFHLEGDRDGALGFIEDLADYVDDANRELRDAEITADRNELINRFASNLGGFTGEFGCIDFCDEHGVMMRDDNHMFFGMCSAAGGTATPVGLAVLMWVFVRRRRARGRR